MLTVDKLIPRGQGLAPVLLRRAPRVALDWDLRQKSRFEATDQQGRRIGVFLPRGSVVRGGDVLVAEDGSLLVVDAAAQAVMVVRGAPWDLLRAAYHLGNRHVALAIEPERLLFEPDPVLAGMLRGLGLQVDETQAAFEPEAGAYAQGQAEHRHAHAHTHGQGDHGHDDHGHGPHGHGHDDHGHPAHAHHGHEPHGHGHHAPAPGPAPAHVHGPGCGHDHG